MLMPLTPVQMAGSQLDTAGPKFSADRADVLEIRLRNPNGTRSNRYYPQAMRNPSRIEEGSVSHLTRKIRQPRDK